MMYHYGHGGKYDKIKADYDQRIDEDVPSAYQADYYTVAARRGAGFSVCQLHGHADVLHQFADPGTEQF